jgi:polyisoprenoid-binding protein YceI
MYIRSRNIWLFAAVLAAPLVLWSAGGPPAQEIDTEKSTMTVRVFKAGLFSAFGHDHEISAPVRQGSVNESDRSVELVVDARQMRVMDKDVSEKDRAEIQETMLGSKVLDTAQFPEIRFHSTSAERGGEGRWTVHGDLTLRGKTRPVKVEVDEQSGRYRGSAELKQRDFGIEPVSVGGGTVKVKDEVRVQFEIVAKP